MKANDSLHGQLIDVDDSILVIIDVQQEYIEKLPKEAGELLVNRISWLADVAVRLNVPIVVTAEDITECGTTVSKVAQKFPSGTKEHNKMIFGLAADAEIMAAVQNTGRKTAVLVGLETDVCVAQSAIGLLQKGYQVVVVADATASPGTGHDFGLDRMRNAGVLISSVKSLVYEWILTIDRAKEFKRKYFKELGIPDGISL